MGFYYTTSPEPENAVPGKSRVPPKTHTPGSRVEKRGYRYYQPEIGRWTARDPIEDPGAAVHIVPLSSISITTKKRSAFERLQEIMRSLDKITSSTGIEIDQQSLIAVKTIIALELNKETGGRIGINDRTPEPSIRHGNVYIFIENNAISNIDPSGLYCVRISRNCAVCVWPDCPQPPYRPPAPGQCPPREGDPAPPTGGICLRCYL